LEDPSIDEDAAPAAACSSTVAPVKRGGKKKYHVEGIPIRASKDKERVNFQIFFLKFLS